MSSRLPGSTGMPKCSIRPPHASIALGITSRRSVIAEAPKMTTISARARLADRRRQLARFVRYAHFVGERSAAALDPLFERFEGLGDDARFQPRQQCRDHADLERTERRDGRRLGAAKCAHAASSDASLAAKGMIFTVATMSPLATARNAGSVATVIASSMRLIASIAATSTFTNPATSAKRLTRPVKGRSRRRSSTADAAGEFLRRGDPRRRPPAPVAPR